MPQQSKIARLLTNEQQACNSLAFLGTCMSCTVAKMSTADSQTDEAFYKGVASLSATILKYTTALETFQTSTEELMAYLGSDEFIKDAIEHTAFAAFEELLGEPTDIHDEDFIEFLNNWIEATHQDKDKDDGDDE